MKKLNELNLNCLVTLDALLNTKSLTLTAKKLNLTQPTISSTLKILRELFDDELLIKGEGHSMQLTHKAKKLIVPTTIALKSLNNVFNFSDEINPEIDELTFNIAMPDYMTSIFANQIAEEIGKYTNLTLNIKQVSNITDYSFFRDNKVDLAIGNYTILDPLVNLELLIKSKMVCLCSNKCRLTSDSILGLDEFFQIPHIRVCSREDFWIDFDQITFDLTGKKIDLAVILQDLFAGIRLLESCPYILIIFNEAANFFSEIFNFKIYDLPFDFNPPLYHMYWDKADDNNKANIWLRNVVRKYLAD